MFGQQKKQAVSEASTRPSEYSQFSDKATGRRFWLPLALVIAAAIIIAPIIWMWALHWADISLGTGGSASTVLATIGGIMGAVFTVGGLVIALVSVYTQLALEARIQQSFEKLIPDLDGRAQMQIEAHLAFTRATDERDWRRAEQLATKALKQWSGLKGVRSYLGKRMAQDVASWFFQREIDHIQPTHILSSSLLMSHLEPGVLSPYGTGPLTAANSAVYVSRGDVPISQSIHWLRDAIAQREDIQGELWAALALIYGVEGQFVEMMEAIANALQADSNWNAYFQESRQLALLVSACRSTNAGEVKRDQLGKVLEYPLPVPKSNVLESLRAVDMSSTSYYQNVYWIALKKMPLSTQDELAPVAILHILLGGTAENRTGLAMWMLGWQGQEVTIPADRTQMPIEQLVEELGERFIFICQHNPTFLGSL